MIRMVDTLVLMTGIDIPIPELKIILHQPTCKEIAMAGRESYLLGAQCLCLDKNSFSQDKSLLANATNFQIFMTIMTDEQGKERKKDVINALQLFFPNYSPKFLPRSFGLFNSETKEMIIIDENNFEILQEFIKDVICARQNEGDFNPQKGKAEEIAAKLRRGRQRIAAQRQAENGGDLFTQYISVVTVGIGSMSLQDAMNLTMFQLYDLVERYALYNAWDIDVRARMAGAKIDKEPDNWMKSIH